MQNAASLYIKGRIGKVFAMFEVDNISEFLGMEEARRGFSRQLRAEIITTRFPDTIQVKCW